MSTLEERIFYIINVAEIWLLLKNYDLVVHEIELLGSVAATSVAFAGAIIPAPSLSRENLCCRCLFGGESSQYHYSPHNSR